MKNSRLCRQDTLDPLCPGWEVCSSDLLSKGRDLTGEKKTGRDIQAQMRMDTVPQMSPIHVTPPSSPGKGLDISDNRHRKDVVEAILWGKPALEEGGQDASFPSKLRHSGSSGMHFLL